MRRVVGGRRRKRSSVAFNWKAFSRFRRAAPRPERLLEVEDDRSPPETETKNKFQCCFTTTEHLVNSSENVFFCLPSLKLADKLWRVRMRSPSGGQ